jgi:hypothetical protein
MKEFPDESAEFCGAGGCPDASGSRSSCTTAPGIIERKYDMARRYLGTRAGLVEFLLSTGG